jgi:hypothetical protein
METTTETPFPAEGIYLNMPEALYHSIPAFSKSLVKKFRISPIDAWEALYGPPKEEQKEHFTYGSALHCLLLEGKEAFDARYCKAFDKSKHPGALDTVDDLKAFLDARGATFPKSASKGALIHIVHTLVPDAPILESLKAEHRLDAAGKTELPAALYDEVVSREWLRQIEWMPEVQATEVSFFWIDEQFHIPCKSRIDAVFFRNIAGSMAACVGDIKTFGNIREKPIADCVAYETGVRGYHIDALFYTRAIKATPRIFHDREGVNWPAFTDTEFHLLYIEKGRAFPNILPREVLVRQLGGLTELGQAASGAIQDAANQYRDLHEAHGKKPWNAVHAADVLTEAHIPIFLL